MDRDLQRVAVAPIFYLEMVLAYLAAVAMERSSWEFALVEGVSLVAIGL
jgi:hypothetical protein